MLTLQLTGEIHTSNLRTWNVSAPTVTMLLAPQRQPLPSVLSRPYWSLWPLMTRWVILICCCNDYHISCHTASVKISLNQCNIITFGHISDPSSHRPQRRGDRQAHHHDADLDSALRLGTHRQILLLAIHDILQVWQREGEEVISTIRTHNFVTKLTRLSWYWSTTS